MLFLVCTLLLRCAYLQSRYVQILSLLCVYQASEHQLPVSIGYTHGLKLEQYMCRIVTQRTYSWISWRQNTLLIPITLNISLYTNNNTFTTELAICWFYTIHGWCKHLFSLYNCAVYFATPANSEITAICFNIYNLVLSCDKIYSQWLLYSENKVSDVSN